MKEEQEKSTGATIKKVYVEGHGCSASLADTEIIGGLLSRRGDYEIVDSESEADMSVLVTCSVKSVTEQRMLSRIRELSSNGTKKLVVAGCLSKAEPQKILEINPGLSLIGPENLDSVLPALNATLSGQQLIALGSTKLVKTGLARRRKNNTIGIVEIASGCLSSCTFCQVKLVKGTVFSYPEDEILAEARNLVKEGAREIWLTSTDNSAYGRDSKTNLARLVRRVCEIDGKFFVRVGMMNPLLASKIEEDLIDAFLDPKVFKFLHLPVQSGSERILGKMQRGYSVDEYRRVVSAFREKIRDLTLSTDFIVGFPTETDEEFEESLQLLRESRPDVVNISRFGAREGTKAATMEGQVNAKVSKERSTKMSILAKEISLQNNKQMWIGWEGEALVDEIGKGALIARNCAYKPCVIKEEELLGKSLGPGEFVRVRSVDCTASTLRTKLVK